MVKAERNQCMPHHYLLACVSPALKSLPREYYHPQWAQSHPEWMQLSHSPTDIPTGLHNVHNHSMRLFSQVILDCVRSTIKVDQHCKCRWSNAHETYSGSFIKLSTLFNKYRAIAIEKIGCVYVENMYLRQFSMKWRYLRLFKGYK